MIYLGTPRRLIGLKCPAVQRESSGVRYAFSETLEGKVKAQTLPAARRVWDISTSAVQTPDEITALNDFAKGAWGSGPFMFVSAEAPNTNMLSPAVAACSPDAGFLVTNFVGGPMLTDSGWAPDSIRRNESGTIQFGTGGESYVPLIPGVMVSASAYVLGDGARVTIVWYNENDSIIGSDMSTVRATAFEGVRSHVTAVPRPGAVYCRIQATSAVQATRPAVTWTDTPVPFFDGRMCHKAVIHGVSSDLVLTRPNRTLQSAEFTVTEVA